MERVVHGDALIRSGGGTDAQGAMRLAHRPLGRSRRRRLRCQRAHAVSMSLDTGLLVMFVAPEPSAFIT